MTKVLEGVRVIELSTIITAPLAGMMLSDLGADVLKVEPPGGDPFRYFRGGNPTARTSSPSTAARKAWCSTCAPTRAATSCLSSIARADVLLENYRAGVMERLGPGRRGAASGKSAADPLLDHRLRNLGPLQCAAVLSTTSRWR